MRVERREEKRSDKGAGAKWTSGGFRRRDGPCAFESVKGAWILEDREERATGDGRRATSDGRISESDRETRTRRVRVRERRDGGQRARQPRVGKIGVRCTLASTVALQSAAALPPGSTATNPNRLVRHQRSIDSDRKPLSLFLRSYSSTSHLLPSGLSNGRGRRRVAN